MYKLNLFKTSFELNAPSRDLGAYAQLWSSPETVKALHREQGARPLYLLHDGPPYANGSLHLGHFVNKSLKDALLKYKRLNGWFAPFVPGFDCHGLPVELEVEKQGHSKADPLGFSRACRAYAGQQVQRQTKEFQSFGVCADWDSAYTTMAPEFEAGAARYFAQLPDRVQRLRPVHWCPACASSLAEAEVEHKPKTSPSLEVLFALEGSEEDSGTGLAYLVVWTTTPYTLPANKAVGFHPHLDYVVNTDEQGRRLVRLRTAQDDPLLPSVSLRGRRALSPWTQQWVPVLPADFVTSSGTGLVHLAPAFGLDDFRVGESHGLVVESYVDAQGRFLQGELQGLSLAQASEQVLQTLQSRQLVHSLAEVSHEYPHCWRHKKPVFFKASEEWFLDLSRVGPQALRALEDVRFTPPAARERLTSMVQARGSWCVSRHRLWGTPLVDALQGPGQDELLRAVAQDGVEAWQAEGPRRTLDVWFDSGVTHELVMRKRFGRTADVYLEGTDQHRGWFQSSLLTSVSSTGSAPYKELVTHGFVVDEQGRKYSKSSGNYLPLEQLFAKYSPDLLRLWVLSQDYTRDLKMSTESLTRTSERLRKVRNTVRFCLQNTQDFDFSQRARPRHPVHGLALAAVRQLVEETRRAVEVHDFAGAVTALTQFVEWCSSDYFPVLKDTLYCDSADSASRREAQSMLARLLDLLLRLLVPLVPFTAEEAFQVQRDRMNYAEASSVLLTLDDAWWQEVSPSATPADDATAAELTRLKREMHQYVEMHRGEGLKGPAQLELTVPRGSTAGWTEDELADYFGCARVHVQGGAERGASQGDSLKTNASRDPLCPCCRRHRPLGLVGLCARCEQVQR